MRKKITNLLKISVEYVHNFYLFLVILKCRYYMDRQFYKYILKLLPFILTVRKIIQFHFSYFKSIFSQFSGKKTIKKFLRKQESMTKKFISLLKYMYYIFYRNSSLTVYIQRILNVKNRFYKLKTCLTLTLEKKKKKEPKPNHNHFYYDRENQLQGVCFQIKARKCKRENLS